MNSNLSLKRRFVWLVTFLSAAIIVANDSAWVAVRIISDIAARQQFAIDPATVRYMRDAALDIDYFADGCN